MRAAFLQLDDALAGQSRLRRRAAMAGGEAVIADDLGPSLRLWSRQGPLGALQTRVRQLLPADRGPRLVFAGSGDFHHVTPTLLSRALESRQGGPVTVLHLDNHPDWVRYAGGLHCGSWVGAAARTPGVAKVVTVGVCSADVGAARARQGDLSLIREDRVAVYAYRAPDGGDSLTVAGRTWPTIETLGLSEFLTRLLAEISTERVYVTLDKDVLRVDDAATNWDQGRMTADELFVILRTVLAHRHVIGADVVGDWSQPAYGGGILAGLMKRGEALLDQPWSAPEGSRADAVNEAVNLRLLDLFAEAA